MLRLRFRREVSFLSCRSCGRTLSRGTSGSELSVSEKSGTHEALVGFAFCAEVHATSAAGAALHPRGSWYFDESPLAPRSNNSRRSPSTSDRRGPGRRSATDGRSLAVADRQWSGLARARTIFPREKPDGNSARPDVPDKDVYCTCSGGCDRLDGVHRPVGTKRCRCLGRFCGAGAGIADRVHETGWRRNRLHPGSPAARRNLDHERGRLATEAIDVQNDRRSRRDLIARWKDDCILRNPVRSRP